MFECDNIFNPELTAEFSSHKVRHLIGTIGTWFDLHIQSQLNGLLLTSPVSSPSPNSKPQFLKSLKFGGLGTGLVLKNCILTLYSTVNVYSQDAGSMSRLSLSIVFRRSSALFQLQLGLVLRLVASQQLGQALLVLQLRIHNHLM